jgi:EAL domain-containing protein (putative c-di-GMP-specific phosphodiesterase class I)
MSQSLGLRVIAEGVETEEQLAFLRDHNCDEFQGFLKAKPMPALEIEKMLLSEAVAAG